MTSYPTISRTPTLLGLELLRICAAMLVFLAHFAQNFNLVRDSGAWLYISTIGDAGVDLFFVLSGFVIALSIDRKSSKDWRTFAIGRFWRIVPIYWLLLLLAATALLVADATGVKYDIPAFSGYHLAASLLFSSQLIGFGMPIVGQGWTLEYEMAFYVMAALALLFSARVKKSRTLAGGLALLAILLNTLFLEFLFGMFAYLIFRSGRIKGKRLLHILALTSGLIGLFGFGIFTESVRFLGWGIPAMAIVVGLSHLEFEKHSSSIVLLGQISYPLYLLQWLSLPLMSRLLSEAGANTLISLLSSAALTGVASWVLYKFYDLPIRRASLYRLSKR